MKKLEIAIISEASIGIGIYANASKTRLLGEGEMIYKLVSHVVDKKIGGCGSIKLGFFKDTFKWLVSRTDSFSIAMGKTIDRDTICSRKATPYAFAQAVTESIKYLSGTNQKTVLVIVVKNPEFLKNINDDFLNDVDYRPDATIFLVGETVLNEIDVIYEIINTPMTPAYIIDSNALIESSNSSKRYACNQRNKSLLYEDAFDYMIEQKLGLPYRVYDIIKTAMQYERSQFVPCETKVGE